MKDELNAIPISDNSDITIEKYFNIDPFFSLSHDYLCIAGYDGYFRKINPAFIKLMGYTQEELFASPISHFVHPQDKLNTAETRAMILEGIPLLHFQNRYIKKNGEIVWLTWTSIPIPDQELIYGISKNITHIKNLEEERNLLLAKFTKVNAEFKQLSYTTSHDLRTPVNNLLSIFSLLDISKIQDKDTLQYIEMLETSVFQLKNTLNKHIDLLNEEDKINVKLEKVHLKNTLNTTMNPLKALIEDSQTTFNIDFSEVTDINFNAFYLHSIFLNLISNSIKYSRPGIPSIISITSKKNEGFIQLIFSDNGLGFDMEKVRGKIFGLHQSFHDHHDSKGIGLYLVNNYMVSLGGTISLESKVNAGATFTLNFRS